jgi:twitching motility protein PilT
MARLDAYIDLLFREQASFLLLETGTGANLHANGGTRPVLRQPLTTQQIIGAVGELVPGEMKERFPGPSLEFRYGSPSGEVQVRFESKGDTATARITPAQKGSDRPAPQPAKPVPQPPKPAPQSAPAAPQSSAPPAEEDGRIVQTAPSTEDAQQAMRDLLDLMIKERASDLHLSSDFDPCLRLDGDIVPVRGFGKLSPTRLEAMLWSITPAKNREEFEKLHDTDFAYETSLARFRVNVFADRKGIGSVMRQIPNKIMSAEEMKLSSHVLDLCGLSKGLVLVTGPTGSGKSTTLAAMIDYINRTRTDHLITIEDPIEFVHPNKKCLVNQREVHTHTGSFKHALRAALREDPDIVLVGEMRDLETIAIALETAETGHLVFGTLHTNTAPSTVDRIIDQFPADRQAQVRTMLSESLKGVITQVLCKKIGGGRVPSQEILLVNGAVANLIREGKTFQIPSIMQTSRGSGMQTMNDALFDLVKNKLVMPDDAMAKSLAKADLKASLKRAGIEA